ncbi:MAG: serine/threonine-protein kinase, partial [Myxococcota bacterium]
MAADEKKFGKYELVRTLGVGGMAQTFMARRFFQIGNEQVARPVCLKQILATYNTDEDFLIRFHLEAKLAIQLQHPNVVKVQDFGDVDGVHFMELELVDGVDLLGLLESQGGRLPVEIVKQIGLDIGAALQYAHNHVPQDTTGNMTPGRRGIIHRDISPSNILISQRGDIKLADFGIAKALSASATAKASRAPLGKLPYMAPERFNRKIPTDGRADLFSLGIVMFECVGGLRPYDGEDDSETIG